MYESPIKVIQGELETQLEGEILKAVHRVGVTVDRDELIRALRYDREQYQKGFDDAREDAVVVTRCKDCKHSWEDIGGLCCSHGACVDLTVPGDFYCAYGERAEVTTICQSCGAMMDIEDGGDSDVRIAD